MPTWAYLALSHVHVLLHWLMFLPALDGLGLSALLGFYASFMVVPAVIFRYLRTPRSPLQAPRVGQHGVAGSDAIASGQVPTAAPNESLISEADGVFKGSSAAAHNQRVAAQAGPFSPSPTGSLPASLLAAQHMVQSKPHRMYTSPLGSVMKVRI
jgi:hypothetical protein